MSQDSLSEKLTELFGLFKSGVLTKEEYDILKSDLLKDGNISTVEKTKTNQIKDPKTFAKKSILEDRLKIDPLNIDILHEYAQFLFDNQLFSVTITVCLKILAINKNDGVAKELRFQSYIKLNLFKDAIEIGEMLIKQNPANISLLETLAEISNKLGISEEVNKYYEQILGLLPSHTKALYHKGLVLLENNQLEEAIDIFKKLNKNGSTERISNIYAGIGMALEGEFQEAINLLNKGILKANNNDINNLRCHLYLSYCICKSSGVIWEVTAWFDNINFKILKKAYHTQDEHALIQIVNYIIDLKLNKIADTPYVAKQFELITSYLNNDYFTEISNSQIAEIWHSIANKHVEIDLLGDALISIRMAIKLNSVENRYIKKQIEIQELIETNRLKRKRKVKILIATTIVGILIIAISIFGYLNYQERKAFEAAKSVNTLLSFQNYLDKYPNGKYLVETKELREVPTWMETKSLNSKDSYSNYLSNYPKGKFESEANDSLRIINEIEKKKAERIEHLKLWNEENAKASVLNELKTYTKWAEQNYDGGYSNENQNPDVQVVSKFQMIAMPHEDIFVTLGFTNIKDNDSRLSNAILSFFEFKFESKWVLSRKDIAFKNCVAWLWNESKFSFSLISQNKYGIFIKESDCHQGNCEGNVELYSVVNDSLKCVLDVSSGKSNTGALGKEEYNSTLVISREGNGYYPIEQVETGTDTEGRIINSKILYKFDGRKYINASNIKPYNSQY